MRRKLNVGIFFDQKIGVGGGYYQALNAVRLCAKCQNINASFKIYTVAKLDKYPHDFNSFAVEHVTFNILNRTFDRLLRLIRSQRLTKILDKFGLLSTIDRKAKRDNLDLIYFISPSDIALDCRRTNFIYTVWDLCHLDQPAFPEVRLAGEHSGREYKYSSVLKRAYSVVVDSESLRQKLCLSYGIQIERTAVIPFEPAPALFSAELKDVEPWTFQHHNEQSIPYIFYPAQFWPHKNHVYIIDALAILRDTYGITVGAVFAGGDMGNLKYLEETIRSSALESQVRFTGYASDEQIKSFYLGSLALAMPTYFGPTNLPPLEAFSLGVPVIYPNLPDMREQVDDAALLIDLLDPASMADAIEQLINEKGLKLTLVKAGKQRLKKLNKSDRLTTLEMVFNSFHSVRSTWDQC